ncbi:hypothetical protein HPB52_018508 [Rhipicephalus sanguineus]|uniref:Inner centromere protein ARK-binding domain-containing protein n=1 Tax=Rhipicephalus sanguineus TaxID=34632 RepID=A0A9D4Q2M4_RHISA|nr:hypothetical protein HPB52_018508 [Rhipicephalus sanguineus]
MLVFASVSHRAAPKRKTRSVSKGSKKSSTKKKTSTVQDEEKSSTSSEDPEKENADVQPKSAVRSTRAASKKGPPAIKVDDATPKEKPSLRQPLRSTRQTRAQAKAQTANLGSATPPHGAGVSRALLFSPANRATTPSKQLFSPYAKCSVQEKARAFESKEPITPSRAAATPKIGNATRNRTTAVAATKEAGRSTPSPLTPMHPASELVTEDRMPATPASPKTPALPSPLKSASKNSSVEEAAAATCEDITPTNHPVNEKPTKRVSSTSPSKRKEQPSSLRSSPPALERDSTVEPTATSPAASPDEKQAPSTPDTEPVKERRITRASVAAAPLATLSKTTSQATPAGVRAASRPYPASSSSTAESDSDDNWVESPTTPKRARLPPTSPHIGSGVKEKVRLCDGVNPTRFDSERTHRTSPPSQTYRRYGDIVDYLVFSTDLVTLGEIKAYKSMEPHNYFTSGCVKSLSENELRDRKFDRACKRLHACSCSRAVETAAPSLGSDREQRLARVQAQRERREAERREQEQLRQREAQQKELERLKQRTAFHQRKQSERSLNVDTLAAATKRKAESPLVSAAKRITPLKISKPPKMARNACADAEAARLIFAQPSTSLSQKAKLNNSLQQQAMLNSLSQSLRSQASFLPSPERPQAASAASQSITELVESTPEKQRAALNVTVTLSSEDKPAEALGETFTMPHDSSVLNTPAAAANSTFVRSEGPPRSSGYDITPHRSELPPEPIKDKNNYDIEDLNSGDETDDDEKPRKEVPAWAKGAALNALVARQNRSGISGLEFFGVMPLLSLDNIFPVKKKTFNKRTSSALWD